MNKVGIVAAVSMLMPMVALAQGGSNNLTSLVVYLIGFINGTLVPLVFALAFIVFLWGVFQYFIFKTEEAKEAGKNKIMFGILGFVVMASVWGLVNFVLNTLRQSGVDVEGTINSLPQAPTQNAPRSR